MTVVLYVDNFEKLYTSLNRLMVEGDLLEVSLPEKQRLRNVLRTCRPTDYEQTVFGFPVSRARLICLHTLVHCMDQMFSKDDGGGGDNWSYMTCKAAIKSSPPTNQHPTFYGPDTIPVAQPTVSRHWRENITFNELAYPKLTWVFQLCLWPLIAPGNLGESCHASHQPCDASTLRPDVFWSDHSLFEMRVWICIYVCMICQKMIEVRVTESGTMMMSQYSKPGTDFGFKISKLNVAQKSDFIQHCCILSILAHRWHCRMLLTIWTLLWKGIDIDILIGCR